MSWEDIGRNEAIRELAKEIKAVRSQKALRDEFAMAALTGIMESIGNSNHEVIARDAYAIADAMMKARDQK